MLLNFQQQFGPFVKDGSKTHTIRGRAAKPGEIMHCFTGLRTKKSAELGRFTCVRSEPVLIIMRRGVSVPSLLIDIAGVRLSLDEANAFAHRDGFRVTGEPLEEMLGFWEAKNSLGFDKPYLGFVNHWNFEETWKRTTPRNRYRLGKKYKWISNTGEYRK